MSTPLAVAAKAFARPSLERSLRGAFAKNERVRKLFGVVDVVDCWSGEVIRNGVDMADGWMGSCGRMGKLRGRSESPRAHAEPRAEGVL